MFILIGFLYDKNDDSTNSFFKKDKENKKIESGEINENHLLYLENIVLGKKRKTIKSLGNVEIGKYNELNIVKVIQNYRLNSNFLNSNELKINLEKKEDVIEYLIYFNYDKKIDKNLILYLVDDDEKIFLKKIYFPDSQNPLSIKLNKNFINSSSINLLLKLENTFFLNIFSWTKLNLNDIRIVEKRNFNLKEFEEINFYTKKKYLDEFYLRFDFDCKKSKDIDGKKIEVEIQNKSVLEFIPNCENYASEIIEKKISVSILHNDINSLKVKTLGHYSFNLYSISKYINNEDVYEFELSDFSVLDVSLFSDFDREKMDIEINGRKIEIKSDESESIFNYMRFGKNTIKFLDNYVAIKEFKIETIRYNR